MFNVLCQLSEKKSFNSLLNNKKGKFSFQLLLLLLWSLMHLLVVFRQNFGWCYCISDQHAYMSWILTFLACIPMSGYALLKLKSKAPCFLDRHTTNWMTTPGLDFTSIFILLFLDLLYPIPLSFLLPSFPLLLTDMWQLWICVRYFYISTCGRISF